MEVAAISEQRCPCCRQKVAEGRHMKLSALFAGRRRRILEIIESRHPARVDKRTLVDILYAEDLDGGPDNAEGVIPVLVYQMNQRLTSTGWKISGQIDGMRDGYGLVRLWPSLDPHATQKGPSVLLTRDQRRILEIIQCWHPDRIEIEKILDDLYAARTKVPIDPKGSVYSQIFKINRQLKPHGWRLSGQIDGINGGYGLVPLEAVA